MRAQGNKQLTRVLLVAGIALLALALTLQAGSMLASSHNAGKASEIADRLEEHMPAISDGMFEQRSDSSMSSVQLDGLDFIGLLELPAYGCRLPVYASWDRTKVTRFPCRYTGSVYGDGLVIGGSDAKGQLDFIKRIGNGDSVYFTDTTGVRVHYTVTSVERTQDVSTENLVSGDSALTLFARNSYGFDYVVLRCSPTASEQSDQ